tara:strand:+ start:979 stop:1896 length:918 start_codon:yes stop_codon:yes gene_type:complete
MGILSEFLAPGASALTAYSGLEDAIGQARETGQLGLNTAERFGQRAVDQTQFRPFTVSTNTGSVATDAQGGFQTQLSPEQQAAQSQLFGQGTGLLGSLNNDPQARTQQLFDQLSGIRQPENERQRLSLEERLFNQGRSGLQTAQYGGAPEQLAMAKAMQEQQSQDLFNARGIAQGEQQQQYNIGSGLFGQSYLPEQQLLPFLSAGSQLSDIANTAQSRGAQFQTALGQTGIEALLGGEDLATGLNIAQTQAIADLFNNMQNPTKGGALAGADSWLDDLFGIGGGEVNTASNPSTSFLEDLLGMGA